MSINLSRNQVGDTLVEVMLATAVLSVVLAGAFTLSNRATRLSQNANEHTEVSNLIQTEAELIQVKHAQSNRDFWAEIDRTANPLLRTGPENKSYCVNGASINDNAFYMDTSDPADIKLTRVNPASDPIEPALVNDAHSGATNGDLYAVWIEAADDPATPTKYTDFFIYACWEGIGGEGMQRSGLVMRLSR